MDVNDRFTAMGELFGGFFAEWMGELLDETREPLAQLIMFHAGEVIFAEPAETPDLYLHELTFTPDDLEERVALMIDSPLSDAFIDIFVEADYNLNIFLVNRDIATVEIKLYIDAPLDFNFAEAEFYSFLLGPGESFTVQIPAESLGELNSIGITSIVGGPLDIEAGFRLTNLPLS
jgi:hypothetical protein